MPKRNSRGRFVKSGHRSSHRSRGRRTTTAIVVAAPRAVTRARPRVVYKKKHHRRGRRHSGGGMNIKHLAIAGAGLAFLTSAASPIQAIPNAVSKIPGAKTFGATTMAGIACLGIDRYIKPNKWLKAAGIVGVIAGALQVGAKGTDFKWVGDAGDEFTGDLSVDGDM